MGPGISAAIEVLVVNIIYSFTSGYIQSSFLGIVIAVIFALILGSLGGFTGKLIRGSGKKAEDETKHKIAKLEKEVAELKEGQGTHEENKK